MNVDLRNMDEAFIKAVENVKQKEFISTNSKAIIKMVLNYSNLEIKVEKLKKERNQYKTDLDKIKNETNKDIESPTVEEFMLYIVGSPFYCVSEIEGRELCNEQCEHCTEYYKPLEQ